MIEIVALIVAIMLLIQVQQLRTVLSFRLPRTKWSAASVPGYDDPDGFMAEYEQELFRLGFTGPTWLDVERTDGQSKRREPKAVYGAPDGLGLLWVSPPMGAVWPHQPAVYFSHFLVDGRTAVSQPFDVYFAMLQGDRLVARTCGEHGVERQWAAHQAWVQSLGSPATAIGEGELVGHTQQVSDGIRDAAIARGAARALTPDVAVLRLPMARRMVQAVKRMTKPQPDTRPVSAARLARLAAIHESNQHNSPPRDVQLWLFAISVALFMALGAIIWDPQLALMILVVVVLHELGHFLAMRAFGYRDVHILALPLIGGVTIGHDANPAATNRAWMSLMGPLPGIVIGWLLLFAFWKSGASLPWLLPFALTFLFVNYLNVLPVPPLDGAHVLESLLPPRWARLQTVIIGAAAVGGALLAMHFGLWFLALIAGLQLFALRGNWNLHGIEREAALLRAPSNSREARLSQILRLLEARFGPAANSLARITQALQVSQRVDVRPMGALARIATTAVYVCLLVVPVGGAILFSGLGAAGGDMTPEAYAAQREAYDAKQANYLEQARALPLATVLAQVSDGEGHALPAPASAEAIATAESRLGRPLPAELRAFYEVANGLPGESIVPIENLAPPTDKLMTDLGYGGPEIVIDVGANASHRVPTADARHWWHLGGVDSTLFYLPDVHPKLPKARVVDAYVEAPAMHPSLRDFLDHRLAEIRMDADAMAEAKAAQARAELKLQGATAAELLDAWPRPTLIARLIAHDDAFPEPASESALSSAEKRLGIRLPEELRSVLARHDGFPRAQLLPAAGIARWRDQSAGQKAELLERLFDPRHPAGPRQESSGSAVAIRGESDIAHCLIVAGSYGYGRETEKPVIPRLLWCPDARPAAWVDIANRRGYSSLREWLLPQAARMQSLRAP